MGNYAGDTSSLVALSVCLVVALLFIVIEARHKWVGYRLRKLVWAAMTNGVRNGYAEEMLYDSEEDVAINLLDYDAEIAALNLSVMDLIPHIESWRGK